MCKVIMRCVHVTNVAVKEQYALKVMSVCL